MRHLLLLGLLLCLPVFAGANRWAEDDYTFGSNGMKKDSLAFFTGISQHVTAGAETAFYRNNTWCRERVYSLRLPLMYSLQKQFISLTPFAYPAADQLHSGAEGGKLSLLTTLTDPDDDNYLHLTVGGAWARQRAELAGGAGKKAFSETAFELQAEKSFYKQFIFMASAAGFSNPSGVSNRTLVTPALDQSDMAYLGTFNQVTALPEWALSMQMARSMKPEYDSYLYAGYSKISLRHADQANSVIMGIKMGLTDKATLDFAYNPFKLESSAWKSYYKISVKLYFDSPGIK